MFVRRIAAVAACWVQLAGAPPAHACGFIEGAGNLVTLREDAAASHFVLFGRAENARGTPDDGSTDLVITKTLKGNPAVAGKKVVTIPRHLPIRDPKHPPLYLVFGEVKGGRLDFVKGVTGVPALAEYAEGLIAIDEKDRVKLMRYSFDFLEHEDATISADAFAVFIKSTDPDISKAAKALAPDKLRRWLQAQRTPPGRLRLYAFLLASCGTLGDTGLLREVLDELLKQESPPLMDGILTAYTLLDPKAGWALTCELMKKDARFMVHYSGLRAARYFRTTQPEVLADADLLRVVGLALGNPDVADIAIDYLRQWKCWKLTDDVLALAAKPGYEAPVAQRSVIRYALQCPGVEAAEFVAEQRKTNSERVKQAEEGLKAEAELAKP